ncbi:MAG: prepilin peptidase [Myxococcales bacterium]|mgnify:CR=1 FL=1|nr:prepilin peptidase [Myxococcales bacterium]HQY60502.1 A24 family peptidase [Polyangiaceae bacterium]
MIPFLIAAVIVSGIAAVYDMKSGQIPNWVTLPALFLAPIAHFVAASAQGIASDEAAFEGGFSVAGACVTAVVPLVLYRQNAIGGGDLKLLAALGALCHPSLGLELEMYAFMAALVIAPARLAYDGKLFRTLKNTIYLMFNPVLPKEKRKAVEPEAMTWFRLGPCIFIGVAVTTAFHWGSK